MDVLLACLQVGKNAHIHGVCPLFSLLAPCTRTKILIFRGPLGYPFPLIPFFCYKKDMDSRPVSLLFVSDGSPARAALAAAVALRRVGPSGRVVAASLREWSEDEGLERVAAEAGLELPKAVASFSDVDLSSFDVIVSFCDRGQRIFPPFPCTPIVISWDVPEPSLNGGKDRSRAFRKLRDRIIQLVTDLFAQGYVESLMQTRANADLIMDNLYDGIIAHDLSRRIFYFNRAAEEITGFNRKEILGRDCHEVFPARFCGERCSFCEGNEDFPDSPVRYPISFHTKQGETRRAEMVVVPMKDPLGRPFGVVATFKDVTRESELMRRLGDVDEFHGIVGREPSIQAVIQVIRDVAVTDAPALIHGESGTGKELVAAAIHDLSLRSSGLFVPVNCGALPDSLLESELFGHVKGAFTGAIRDKKGRFELADGGTLFLDEIGDISPAMQVKLLRVLEDGIVERLGCETGVKVDVRVVAATNKDLRAEVAAGRFREDLYYRLSVVPIHLPPLRERRGDIPLIAQYLLKKALENSGRQGVVISKEAMEALSSYDWPGNVRELSNALQYALVRCKGALVEPIHLPPGILQEKTKGIMSSAWMRRRPNSPSR